MKLTSLESDIIQWLSLHCVEADVQRQLPHVILRDRDYTGVGFFLRFSLPQEVTPAIDSESDCTPFPGPDISSPELTSGAGTVVFCTNGKIDCIEIFAYDDSFPEQLVDYTLS